MNRSEDDLNTNMLKGECAAFGVLRPVKAFSYVPKANETEDPETLYVWRHLNAPKPDDSKCWGKFGPTRAAADNTRDLLVALGLHILSVRLREHEQEVFRDCKELATQLCGEWAEIDVDENPNGGVGVVVAKVQSVPGVHYDPQKRPANLPQSEVLCEGAGMSAYDALIPLRDKLREKVAAQNT